MGTNRAGGTAREGDGLAHIGHDLIEGVSGGDLRGPDDVDRCKRDGENFC